MENGGFVSWDDIDFKGLFNRFHCPYCMGVRIMPTEEELEQRITDSLDDREKELKHARAAIMKLELDRLNEIFEKGGDRG